MTVWWVRGLAGLALMSAVAACEGLPLPGASAPNDAAAADAGDAGAQSAGTQADIALASGDDPALRQASRRGFLGLFGGDGGGAGNKPELSQPKPGEAVGETVLTGGIIARAPAGYCVDPSLQADFETSDRVAIMASCPSVSGKTGGADVPSAILTVTVGRVRLLGGQAVTADALVRAFEADGPRAAKGGEGLAVVQLERGGDRVIKDASGVHWRGVMKVGPRLVGLAVYVPKGSALVGARGGDLIRDLASAVRDASVIARDGGQDDG